MAQGDRRGSGSQKPPHSTTGDAKRTTPAIVDELLDEGKSERPRSETVSYSKAKFASPSDPNLKTQVNERVTARRLPAVTDIPDMTMRDLPPVQQERERLLTPGPASGAPSTPAISPPATAASGATFSSGVGGPSPTQYASYGSGYGAVERPAPDRATTQTFAPLSERVTAERPAQAAPAGGERAPAMTAPSLQTVMNVQAPELVPPPDAQKTKVWVATHKLPAEPDERLILLNEPDSPRAASYRVLRHRLAEQSDARVIVVSSPEAREGKTTCAVNLALALGECGRARVLLVEANLRHPQLASVFGFLPPECFAQQLVRHRERPQDPWSVVEVGSPSLHVAAVKPGADAERPLLDGVAFGIALDMLRRAGYDYIVLDTPPVLGSADVNLVEDFADGVLLTAWSRKTSSRKLRRAIDQLQPGKILGVTLLDA